MFALFRILESQNPNKYFARFLQKAFCGGFCGYEVLEVFACMKSCLFFSFCAKSAQIEPILAQRFYIAFFSLLAHCGHTPINTAEISNKSNPVFSLHSFDSASTLA